MKTNNSIFLPEIAEVVSTRQLTEMEKYIELKIKETREFNFNPGQFIQLSVFGIGEALSQYHPLLLTKILLVYVSEK